MDFWKCQVRLNYYRFAKHEAYSLPHRYLHKHFASLSTAVLSLRALKAVLGIAKLTYGILGISGTIHLAYQGVSAYA